MPFTKSYRKLQRFRRWFACCATKAEDCRALDDSIVLMRRLARSTVERVLAGNPWPLQTERKRVAVRRKTHAELCEVFEENRLPSASAASQVMLILDRFDGNIEILDSMPLIFGNAAKSINTQAEIEVFLRGSTLGLKFGKSKTARVLVVEIDDVPPSTVFVQMVEVFPDGKLGLVVVNNAEGIAVCKAGTSDRRAGVARRKLLKVGGKDFALVGSELYLIDEKASAKMREKLVELDDAKREKLAEWIRAKGEHVATIEVLL